jgi:chitin disaccharide deacetylase
MTGRVVIHADDLGMSHGANAAFAELWNKGTVTSGSVMVPCPWFSELAHMARAHPAIDIGVHLTLTSEMTGYRWRPLTRPPASAGLTDAGGFFHCDVPTLRARADRAAVEAELRAQIDAALAAGIDVTHLDDHMGAVLAPEFAEIYARLAVDYRLPPLFSGTLATYGGQHNMTGITAQTFAPGVEMARASGFPIFDRIVETDWHPTAPPDATYRAMLDSSGEGLTFLALHFTKPGEIEVIDPGFHNIRTAEYTLFRSPGFADWLHRRDVTFIGMRALRDDWRAHHAQGGTAWTASASA